MNAFPLEGVCARCLGCWSSWWPVAWRPFLDPDGPAIAASAGRPALPAGGLRAPRIAGGRTLDRGGPLRPLACRRRGAGRRTQRRPLPSLADRGDNAGWGQHLDEEHSPGRHQRPPKPLRDLQLRHGHRRVLTKDGAVVVAALAGRGDPFMCVFSLPPQAGPARCVPPTQAAAVFLNALDLVTWRSTDGGRTWRGPWSRRAKACSITTRLARKRTRAASAPSMTGTPSRSTR
jgi:hypothetical protein